MTSIRPNVVLFISHDTGRHLSPYGIDQVHTPHSQRLAEEGVVFSQAFCTSPLCSPSRAAIVTGRYPHQNGVMGLSGRPTGLFDLYEGEQHAARLFAGAGYESVLCGFEHETSDCTSVGFERLLCGSGKGTNGGGDLRDFAGGIATWLDSRPSQRPFYLQIGCHETHQQWTANQVEPDTANGVWMPPYLADNDDIRREMGEFQGAVRRLDQELGSIRAALEEAGQWENTIFVFTTDHGIDLPRAKGTCFDPGLEVFLQLSFPAGGWGQGCVIERLTSTIDILPTLLQACGIAVPDKCAGQSLVPLLEGGQASGQERIFAEKTFHDTYDPMRCVRTQRYKYIRYFEVNIFEDLRLATMTRRHYWEGPWRRANFEEALYDLEQDPLEMDDVAEQPHYAEIKAQLKGALARWMQETNDPLLQGPVPSPYYRAGLEDLRSSL